MAINGVRFALALAPITEGDKINVNEIERGKPELALKPREGN